MPQPVDPLGHRERGLGGLLAPVPHLATGARPRLLLAQRRHHAEGRWHAGGERHLADPGGRLARDELEVGCLAADDHADAHDARVAPGRREVLGGLRELERPRYPVDLDGVPGEARAAEHLERAVHETLRDALVEAGCDDREPEGAPQRTRAAHSGRATGHLSPGATKGDARACRASCSGTSGWRRWPGSRSARARRCAGRSPQSHRREWKTSPIRHSEWTRTSTGASPATCPMTRASGTRLSTLVS